MNALLFSESPDENTSSDTDSTIPVTTAKLDVGGESPITISNFREQLPDGTSAKTRGTLVRALEATSMLTADARHALARATVHPDDLAPQVRNRSLIVETGETADVTQITGQVFTTELWPLLQPRTEAEAITVARPIIVGELDEDGKPLALLTMRFRSLQHLAEYLHETIALTGRTGNDYSASILARRVGRAVLAHVVRLEFTDGTPSFLVVALRDGNTRLVSSVAARMGLRTTDGKVADQLVEDLLATVPPRAGKQPDPAIDRARGRDRVAQELRTRFNAGMATGRPTEDAIRIGQTFTLPATVYLHVEASATAAVPPEQVFPESMRAVVGSIHTEFKGWDTAAQSVDVGERALQRAQYAGRLPADLVGLATGALDVQDVPKVFGDSSIPPTALWRGVFLVHGLTQVSSYAAVKEQLRSLLGLSVIQRKKFATYLGPMVDVPWRASKHRSLVGARRAWGATGPIPHALLGTDWQPVPTSDFLSLVPRALAGDTNARYTLQVAGGIALVADRLLASNTGSSVDYGTVPFRADVHEVVATLGGPANMHGLYQLAHAAQVFDADRAAVNSFTDRDFATTGKALPTGAYVVPLADPADPTRPLLDATGQPVPLTQWEVVRISNPERAAKAISEAKADAQNQAGFTVPESAADKAQDLRLRLENGLKAIQDLIAELERVSSSGEPSLGPALGTPEDWMRLSVIGNKVSSWITMNEPPEPNTDAEDVDDALDEDEEGERQSD